MAIGPLGCRIVSSGSGVCRTQSKCLNWSIYDLVFTLFIIQWFYFYLMPQLPLFLLNFFIKISFNWPKRTQTYFLSINKNCRKHKLKAIKTGNCSVHICPSLAISGQRCRLPLAIAGSDGVGPVLSEIIFRKWIGLVWADTKPILYPNLSKCLV